MFPNNHHYVGSCRHQAWLTTTCLRWPSAPIGCLEEPEPAGRTRAPRGGLSLSRCRWRPLLRGLRPQLWWFGSVCALPLCKAAGWGFVRVLVFACSLIIEVIGACYNQNKLRKKRFPWSCRGFVPRCLRLSPPCEACLAPPSLHACSRSVS